MHQLVVGQGADAELEQEALVTEDLVLVEDLLHNLAGIADEVGAAQGAGGLVVLAAQGGASRARGRSCS